MLVERHNSEKLVKGVFLTRSLNSRFSVTLHFCSGD